MEIGDSLLGEEGKGGVSLAFGAVVRWERRPKSKVGEKGKWTGRGGPGLPGEKDSSVSMIKTECGKPIGAIGS